MTTPSHRSGAGHTPSLKKARPARSLKGAAAGDGFARRLIEDIPQAVALLDLRGRLIQWNPVFSAKFGEPGPGSSLDAHFDPPGLKELVRKTAAGGGPVRDAEVTLSQAPQPGHGGAAYLVSLSLIEAEGAERLLLIVDDITARKEQHARMIASSRLVSVGEMAAGVAHELNNPLTAILGFSQLALRQDVDDVLKRDLEAIATEAERAGRIVDNLLSFARSHNSGNRVFDPAASIQKILDLREYECRVNNIEVVTYFDPDTPKTMADVHKMEQVVLNLLGNAVQAIADGHGHGTITVGLVAMDGKVRISITDDGPGIPPDVLPRIFQPFFTTKPVGKGTGQGLSICQSIVQEHGGEIKVESRPRRGTTFVVEIPIVPVAEPAPTRTPSPQARPTSYTMLRVLAVDDEPVVLEMLARALAGMGHQVDVSRDGAEALRMIHLTDYDAILLDLRMPGLGGPEVYRCLQGLRPDFTGRVLFITGDTVSSGSRSFVGGLGAEVLQKPFSLEELRHRMGEFAAAKDRRMASEEAGRRPDLSLGLTRMSRGAGAA